MIHIDQDQQGLMKIDYSDEESFAASPHAFELSSGLFVVTTTSHSLIADVAGNPVAVVDYAVRFLRQHGYEVSVDPKLASRMVQAQSEVALIEAVKSGKQQPLPIRSAAKFGVKRQ